MHIRTRTSRRLASVAVAAISALVLAGCGGGDIKTTDAGGSSGGKCGDFNIAINPWVGYEASAHVLGYVAKTQLGCKVTYKDLKEEVAWQGFGSGTVDLVVENWGHADLVKKYIDGNKTAVDLGPNGNVGIISWYVPPWIAKAHPDILDWKNLNKYADKFKTSESGGKGQLLDGDPSYVTNDEALVKNLKLNYKVVYTGSEPALIQAYRKAEQNKTWAMGYWYTPQWFNSEVPMVKINLPKYTEGCDADTAKVACDYPEYQLNKVASKKWVDAGGPAVDLSKKFKWTNDDQNLVAKYIAQDKMDPEEAAKKWVDANPDKVKAWLG